MSAIGYIYVTEICRDVFEKELNEVFGKANWYLNNNEVSDYYVEADIPLKIEVDVLDRDTDEVIGSAIIISENYIEDNGMGKYIDIKPISITISKNDFADIDNYEELNNIYETLTDKQKLDYMEYKFGELLADIWRDYDEESFNEEKETIKEYKK